MNLMNVWSLLPAAGGAPAGLCPQYTFSPGLVGLCSWMLRLGVRLQSGFPTLLTQTGNE